MTVLKPHLLKATMNYFPRSWYTPFWMVKPPSKSGVNIVKMPQQETAEKAGICVLYLYQLETRKHQGSLTVLSAIARVFQVPLENIYKLTKWGYLSGKHPKNNPI